MFNRPINMEEVELILRQTGNGAQGNPDSGFYEVTTSEGIKRWPRVTSILDGMGGNTTLPVGLSRPSRGPFVLPL